MTTQTIVLSKPACVQCTATMRYLDTNGVDYRVIDLMQDGNMMRAAQENGFQQAPIVLPDGTWDGAFSGFQPGKLDELVAR